MYEERRWGDVLVCLQDVGQMADAHRIVFLDVNSIAQETELRVELGLEGTVLVLPWSSVVPEALHKH